MNAANMGVADAPIIKKDLDLQRKFFSPIRESEERNGIPRFLLSDLLTYDAQVIAGKKRNPIGAIGIAQLMPDVAKRFGVSNRTDPYDSIAGAGRYLKHLYLTFGSWKRAAEAFKKSEELEYS